MTKATLFRSLQARLFIDYLLYRYSEGMDLQFYFNGWPLLYRRSKKSKRSKIKFSIKPCKLFNILCNFCNYIFREILVRLRFIKKIIQITAFVAAWTAILSLISGYWHIYTDVLAGSILGLIVALFATLIVDKIKKNSYL